MELIFLFHRIHKVQKGKNKMFNLVATILCSITGAALILNYGRECAGRRRYNLDVRVVLACFNLILAGLNLAKYLEV